MNLISIPSEYCPKCKIPNGNCAMVVRKVDSLRDMSVKNDEPDFRAEVFGKRKPNWREAYTVEEYVCLHGGGQK